MLADVFENYWNMFLEIYEVDPANIFSATGLAWQAGLKKPKVKWDLLTDIDMLLMAKKVWEVEHVTLFIDMWKLIMNI